MPHSIKSPKEYTDALRVMGLDNPIEVIFLQAHRENILVSSPEHVANLEKKVFNLALEEAKRDSGPEYLQRRTFRQLAIWDVADLAEKYWSSQTA